MSSFPLGVITTSRSSVPPVTTQVPVTIAVHRPGPGSRAPVMHPSLGASAPRRAGGLSPGMAAAFSDSASSQGGSQLLMQAGGAIADGTHLLNSSQPPLPLYNAFVPPSHHAPSASSYPQAGVGFAHPVAPNRPFPVAPMPSSSVPREAAHPASSSSWTPSVGPTPAIEAGTQPSTSSLGPVAPESGPRSTAREESVAKQTRRTLDREIGPRVDAALASGEAQRVAEIEAVVRRRLGEEEAVRNAVRATIWQEPSPRADGSTPMPSRADYPPASADGYINIRIHESRLDTWLATSRAIEAASNRRIDALEARVVTAERQLSQLAPRAATASTSREPLGALDSNADCGDRVAKKAMFNPTDAQTAARKLVARLYGLNESFHAKVKPYHIPYPADGDVPYHPSDYRPTRADHLASKARKEVSRVGSERRFPQMRYNWAVGPREGSNGVWTNAILQSLCEDWQAHGIPRWATPEFLWSRGLATTFENIFKEEVKNRDEDALRRRAARDDESKHRERLKRKAKRRAEAAGIDTSAPATNSDPDLAGLFVSCLMSPEYKHAEIEARAGPSLGDKRKHDALEPTDGLVRPELEWRAGPITHLFREVLDAINPPHAPVRNSGEIMRWPAGKVMKGGISRCAISEAWAKKNLHVAPQLVPNRGPYYPAKGALALDADSFGPPEADLGIAARRRLVAGAIRASDDAGPAAPSLSLATSLTDGPGAMPIGHPFSALVTPQRRHDISSLSTPATSSSAEWIVSSSDALRTPAGGMAMVGRDPVTPVQLLHYSSQTSNPLLNDAPVEFGDQGTEASQQSQHAREHSSGQSEQFWTYSNS
ncbi:hypothetical protein OC844_004654 [Tilletia horrida]|nr:hypothetical protein OC844_004654 [Tilletia horrida]